MASALCDSDFACEDNEMCYTDVSWYNVADDPNSDGCLCNTWYGWTGDNCDEYSATTIGLILWNLLTMFMGVATLAVLVRSARIYMASRRRLCHYTVTTATILFSVLATAGSSMWAFIQLMSTALTTGAPLADYESSRDIYKGRWNILANVFGPIGTFFAALALLQISLMWVEVSVRSGQLSVESRNQLVHTRRLVYLFQVLAVVIASAGAAVEKTKLQNVMGFFILPLMLAVVSTYISGALRLTKILNASAADRKRFFRTESKGEGELSTNATSMSVVGSPPGVAEASPGSPEPLGRAKQGAKALLKTVRSFNIGGGSKGSMEGEDAADSKDSGSMSGARVGGTPFVDILRRIRNTSVLVCLSLGLFEAMYLALSITDAVYVAGWKELAPPDQFFTIKSVHNLLMTSIVLSQMVVAWYILRSVQNTLKQADLAARR